MYNVLDYGAVGSGSSTADDTAGIKAAIAACPAGDTVLLPATSAFFSFDTSGGQSAAALIDKRISVLIEGEVRATVGAVRLNPPTVFRITSPGVTFEGSGTLRGSGTTDDFNGRTEEEFPSLIRVEANSFTMRGLTIDTPHKIGVYLWGSYDSRIVGNTFTGGPRVYADTAYFAIRANEGGRHTIANNQFLPDATGGMYVNCIFFKGTAWSVIEGNVAQWPFEKLCYIAGSHNVIANNVVIGRAPSDANGGIIPGTNQAGTVGAVYRADGQYNKIRNNSSQYGGGAQSIGGKGTEVSGNVFLDCGQSGVTIYGGAVDLSDISIAGNYITCGDLPGVVVGDGILVRPASAPAQGPSRSIQIVDNVVRGFSKADPVASVAAWQPNTVYSLQQIVRPTVSNGISYVPRTAGISGSSEPLWPTSQGGTVNDGSLEWVGSRPDTDLYAQIRISAPEAGKEAVRCVIARNQLSDGERAISTALMRDSEVHDNRIGATRVGVVEVNGTNNRYRNSGPVTIR